MAMNGKAGRIASSIGAQIASGVYQPGAMLPAERRLAEDYGVARNTLRAALAALEQEGLIRQEGRRGAIVCAPTEAAATVLLTLPAPEDLPTPALSPEATALVGATLCACGGSSVQFLLQSMPASGTELVQLVRQMRAAGVVLIECHDLGVLAALDNAGIPHVVVNQEHDVPGPATRVDFWRIGYDAASHLLELGHTRLAMLSGPAERHMYGGMRAGWQTRCDEAGVTPAPEYFARTSSCSEEAREAALAMLSLPRRPSALFCTRDARAYGAYLAAREIGLRVPEDLSLVGYDDITWPGEGRRFLTTFPEPAGDLGGAAVRMLRSWLRSGRRPEDTVVCPRLVARASTGPAPAE